MPLPCADHPNHQVLDCPVFAGHFPQPLLLRGDDQPHPEPVAFQTLPQELPLSM